MRVSVQQHASCIFQLSWTAFLLIVACQRCPAQTTAEPELYGYEVVAEYPHDNRAFTQGLQYDVLCQGSSSQSSCREVFWESTGLWGSSSIRLVDLQTGNTIQRTAMSPEWFGEGATRLGNRIYQIVWQSGQGFIYSVPDLKQVGTFTTPLGDGWGITADGRQLVISDGSDKLTWVDPANFSKVVKQISVTDGKQPIGSINELEMIGGEIWANVWNTQCIARICPETGKVKGWMLMHGLRDSLLRRNLPGNNRMDVLNGVAWDHQRQRLFITGKNWPRVFEVVPQPIDSNDPDNKSKRRTCYQPNQNSG